ncbi:MAG: nucleoside hydrolase [candidate division KSB1 bacterium]|nr:nucleoside hydrolase [candidate division KSB1 bacterium]MDZ7346327.1 nucleoside hydrolase [candidate division KSB1 bacterium]
MKALWFICWTVAAVFASVPKVIFDTDMNGDVDDVGALALLHVLADNGEVEILGCMTSHPANAVCRAVDVINTFYHRPDLPIGAVRGGGDNGQYAAVIAQSFPNDAVQAEIPLPVELYRKILAEQPDSSVTLITVGFLPNIAALLRSGGDHYSELNGIELVKKKVKEWVCMGGVFPAGKEYNLSYMFSDDAVFAVNSWPCRLIFTGWEIGKEIFTGRYVHEFIAGSPVKAAYQLYNCTWAFDGNPYIAYYHGHYSWDLTAVWIAVRGYAPFWDVVDQGYCYVKPDGSNEWRTDDDKDHFYVVAKMPAYQIAEEIDRLLNLPPIGAYIKKSSAVGWLPCLIEFDGRLTRPPKERTVQEYHWRIGDVRAEGEVVAYNFTTPGMYPIELTAKMNDSAILTAVDSVRISDPIFSGDPFYGDARNYRRIHEDLWSTTFHQGDLRYHLSADTRTPAMWDGFCFVRDTLFTTFALEMLVCSELDPRSAEFKILFGVQDEQNYNLLQGRAALSRLYAFRNGKRTVNGVISANLVPDDQFHRIYLVNDGTRLTVYFDGVSVFSQTDADLLRAGAVGFGSDRSAFFFDDISISSPVAEASKNQSLPKSILLLPNFPNPFNSLTTIPYELDRDSFVSLTVHDHNGRILAVPVKEYQTAGQHEIVFDASHLPSGVYFYRLAVTSQALDSPMPSQIKKMLLLK